jgi:hypothetical protein
MTITDKDYQPDAIDIAIKHKNNLVLSLWSTLKEIQALIDAEESVLSGSDQLLLATLETHPVVKRAGA